MGKKNSYISLKEAGEISGYAPDYVGQLIRNGKLPGKQVFSNVQWMTTEEAVRDYIAAGKNGKKDEGTQKNSFVGRVGSFEFHKLSLAGAYQGVLYGSIVLGAFFFLFLFYVFSVNLEKKLEKRTLQRAQVIEVIDTPLPLNEKGELLLPL